MLLGIKVCDEPLISWYVPFIKQVIVLTLFILNTILLIPKQK